MKWPKRLESDRKRGMLKARNRWIVGALGRLLTERVETIIKISRILRNLVKLLEFHETL